MLRAGKEPWPIRGYPESFRPQVDIEAQRASEECAIISEESQFLTDPQAGAPSGFDVPINRANFPDSLLVDRHTFWDYERPRHPWPVRPLSATCGYGGCPP